jgi:hypothetical protein
LRRDTDLEATLVAKYAALSLLLNERAQRLWAAAESVTIGYGGDAVVSSATGLSPTTIRRGPRELTEGGAPAGRLRRPGAGRPRGDPTSTLRWTCKSEAKVAAAVTAQGLRVSATTVGRLVHDLGYRLQARQKTLEGTAHPDRNAQFEYITATATAFLQRRQPVISVDTKKKELIGDFKTGGRQWQPSGQPEPVRVHDFPGDAVAKRFRTGCTTWRATRPG